MAAMLPLTFTTVLLYASTTVAVTPKYSPATTSVLGHAAGVGHGQRDAAVARDGTGETRSAAGAALVTSKGSDATESTRLLSATPNSSVYPEHALWIMICVASAAPAAARKVVSRRSNLPVAHSIACANPERAGNPAKLASLRTPSALSPTEVDVRSGRMSPESVTASAGAARDTSMASIWERSASTTSAGTRLFAMPTHSPSVPPSTDTHAAAPDAL
mmetsp:Transcript_51965/g.123695  ORF Transcript_51965/g.123695 Transcript_51965/m.123695 type:complete len:218 (+) Transcript_51965:1737-2390(+)